MAIFEFSKLTMPEIEDKLTPPKKRRLLNNISALMLTQRFEVFQNEGANEKWAALSPKYAAWKLRKYGGKSSKILSLSNALRMSFSSASGGKPSGDGEVIIKDDSAAIETHVKYAAIQNFGGTILIPPRKSDQQAFKIYHSGQKAGQHQFASKKDIEKGNGRNFTVLNRTVTVHRQGVYATIPARPFDQFREKDQEEIAELTEGFING